MWGTWLGRCADVYRKQLEQIRALYSELKLRYERECSSQKIRIAELTSDMTNANSVTTELQSDFNKFVGESRTIVKVSHSPRRVKLTAAPHRRSR